MVRHDFATRLDAERRFRAESRVCPYFPERKVVSDPTFPRPMSDKTHFGFEEVAPGEKAQRVRGVFESVADKYDLMNDLMSLGLHRLWKRFAVNATGVRPGMRVLDLAGGTGDLARLFAERVGSSGA